MAEYQTCRNVANSRPSENIHIHVVPASCDSPEEYTELDRCITCVASHSRDTFFLRIPICLFFADAMLSWKPIGIELRCPSHQHCSKCSGCEPILRPPGVFSAHGL